MFGSLSHEDDDPVESFSGTLPSSSPSSHPPSAAHPHPNSILSTQHTSSRDESNPPTRHPPLLQVIPTFLRDSFLRYSPTEIAKSICKLGHISVLLGDDTASSPATTTTTSKVGYMPPRRPNLPDMMRYSYMFSDQSLGVGASAVPLLEGEVFRKTLSEFDVFDEDFDYVTCNQQADFECPYRFVRDIECFFAHPDNWDTHLRVEGIFRKNGKRDSILEVCEVLDMGEEFPIEDLSQDYSVHDIAGVYKMFFSVMREPILTFELYPTWIKFSKSLSRSSWKSDDAESFRSLVQQLPEVNVPVLSCCMKFLCLVSQHAEANRMSAENLAFVFASSFLRPVDTRVGKLGQTDVDLIVRLVETMIEHAEEIFALI